MPYLQQLYFRFKDQVFVGSRPYPSKPFEKFLMEEFGENTKMSSVAYPRYVEEGLTIFLFTFLKAWIRVTKRLEDEMTYFESVNAFFPSF